MRLGLKQWVFALAFLPTVLLPVPGLAQSGVSANPSYLLKIADDVETYSPLARLLRRATELIDARRYREAYALLNAEDDLYAGDVEFDYLFAISAMETGEAGKAVLSLERVLINRPEHLLARAEIARAYLLLREQENARREFEIVAAQKLPAQAKAVIARYLDSLSRIKNQPGPLIKSSVSVHVGFDNNVNIGAHSENWLLADGTRVTPLTSSLPSKSTYIGSSGAIQLALPLNGRVQWISGLSGMVRNYASAHTLDQQQVDVSTGFVYRNKCHQFKMRGQLQFLSVDHNAFRNSVGVVGQWQCDLGARRQVGAYVQRFDFKFPDQNARDAARQSLGMSYAQIWPKLRNAVILGSVQTGREYSKAGLPELSFDFTGIRLMLLTPITNDWRGTAGINWEQRRFDGPDQNFGLRRDRQTEVRLGLESDIDKHWTLQPQLVLTRNRSSLAPSDFSRTQAQLVARYRIN